MRSAWTWILLCFTALALAGCGGGGGGSAAVTSANVTLGVDWAARGRNVNAPSSALSMTATIVGGSEQNTDVVISANRNAAPAAYSEILTFPTAVKLGQQTLQIRFFSQAGGAGTVVGTANTPITVVAGGTRVGTVTTTATVTSVTVNGGLTLRAGTTQDVAVTPRDSANNIVAVSPGSIIYNVTAGANRIRVTNGQLEAVQAGTATLTASVDGVTSTPTDISVAPDITKLEVVENAAFYGKVRVRAKGIGALTDTVTIQIGGVAAIQPTITATDANAPADTFGGVVEFVVPTGLPAGQNNLFLTVNGITSVNLVVNVSNTNPFAVFTMANGNKFVAELRRDVSPNTVDNFTGLATGTKQWTPTYSAVENNVVVQKTAGTAQNTPLYNGTKFHRVIAGFVRQGGDPITKQTTPPADWSAGTGNPGFFLNFETNALLHEDGALAMARSNDPNSAGSQFYICDGAQTDLNGSYVVFGKVVEGLTRAKAIAANDVLTSVVITGKLDAPQ